MNRRQPMQVDGPSLLRSLLEERLCAEAYRDARVLIAVPDGTRKIDYDLILRPLLQRLQSLGAEVSLLVALGLHRPMTSRELRPLVVLAQEFGVDLSQHEAHGDQVVRVVENIWQDRSVDGQKGSPRLPVFMHHQVLQADRVICVGAVEPHQYAGFSGGVKTVSIGCAGAETIATMHGLELLRMSGTRVARVNGNPFQSALRAIAATLGPIDALLFVPSSSDALRHVAFGPAESTHDICAEIARSEFMRPIPDQLDWLHLPVEPPKSSNFYQASRAATYAALVDQPAVRPGGLLILDAPCPEGVGQGAGERACARAMARGAARLRAELLSDLPLKTEGGQQRAYVLARALDHCQIALVGAPPIPALAPMGIRQFTTPAQALLALRPGRQGASLPRPTLHVPYWKQKH